MAIQWHIYGLAQGGDYRRPNGDVWNEVAIHNVNMEQGASSLNGLLGVRSQPGEISRQDRGRDLNHLAI
jgi:hypothetical protein